MSSHPRQADRPHRRRECPLQNKTNGGTSRRSVPSPPPSDSSTERGKKKKVGTVGETREGTTRKHYIHADTGTQVSCRVTQNVDRLQLTNAIKQQLLSFFSLPPWLFFVPSSRRVPLPFRGSFFLMKSHSYKNPTISFYKHVHCE